MGEEGRDEEEEGGKGGCEEGEGAAPQGSCPPQLLTQLPAYCPLPSGEVVSGSPPASHTTAHHSQPASQPPPLHHFRGMQFNLHALAPDPVCLCPVHSKCSAHMCRCSVYMYVHGFDLRTTCPSYGAQCAYMYMYQV